MNENLKTAAYYPAKPFYPDRNLRGEFTAAFEIIASLPAKLKRPTQDNLISELKGCTN